jgi:hypothetical protein
VDFSQEGFSWIDCADWEQSIISFLRMGRRPEDTILVVLNFTPVARFRYRLGVPWAGFWTEVLNSDALEYAGGGLGNLGGAQAEREPKHGRPMSLSLTIPGLTALFFKAPPPPPRTPSSNSAAVALSEEEALRKGEAAIVAWHDGLPHAGERPPDDDASSRED